MRRAIIAGLAWVTLTACVMTPEQMAETEILDTWEQFETYYNAGDLEGVKSLLFIEGLDADAQTQVEAETAAMAGANAWMMSPNVGVSLDADVNVRSIDGDEAILDGTLKHPSGQSIFFSMVLNRIDGKWLLAPAGMAPTG